MQIFHKPQRWTEQTLRQRPHAYLSSMCRHEQHDKCVDGPDLRQCRVCGTSCMCRCHHRAKEE